MNENMMRISVLIILMALSFQLYAKETNSFPVRSDKDRLEKLELGVAELGAERERARTIRQDTHDDTETRLNITNPTDKTKQSISNTKRLEYEVLQLGAERERIRAQVQDRK